MWNTIRNPSLNSYYQFMEHKGHLQRMLIMRPEIDTATPFVPKFFLNHAGSVFSSHEKKRQINLDNKYLYNKLYQINLHPSRYSKEKNIPSLCPAFESLTYNKKNYYKTINKENSKLKKRFIETRPVISYRKFEKDFQRSLKYKKNISNFTLNNFPNLYFDTFHNFQGKIMNIIDNEDNDINKKRKILKNIKIKDDFYKRPMSASVRFNKSWKMTNKNTNRSNNYENDLNKMSLNSNSKSNFNLKKNKNISIEHSQAWLD